MSPADMGMYSELQELFYIALFHVCSGRVSFPGNIVFQANSDS
ncbi:rCG59476 [Rattus norvegicus]|uniref:RCG59476 n=1 Tax=Rattus norvegicus TaxID=10116 RepID=A6HTC8_RAT|nr:rCG59476 [Rattus norvegicus]